MIDSITNKAVTKKIIGFAVAVLMVGQILISDCYIANAAYMKMQLANEQAQSYFNTLITQIKGLDGYSDELKIIYIGKAQDKSLTDNAGELFEDITLMGITTADSLVGMRYRDKYLEYYCGFVHEQTTVSDAGISQQTLADMPCYPIKGAVQIINDTIVVKFKDKDVY